MIKIYFILLIFGLFSCRQNADFAFKNNNSATSWSKNFKKAFITDCITKASEKVDASKAFSYCDCLTDKVELKFPDENEVSEKFTNVDEENINEDCPGVKGMKSIVAVKSVLTTNWSSQDKEQFTKECILNVKKNLGASAGEYCSCMLSKIITVHPDVKDVENVTKNQITVLAVDCLAEIKK